MASEKFIWGGLLHLGANMWSDIDKTSAYAKAHPEVHAGYSPVLECDEKVWRETTEKMAAIGMNMCMVDVGESLIFPSHPELAVKGSWSPEKMNAEVHRLRALGLEPIPKLNFSTSHDAWLQQYGRMVSTPKYYQVCADTIRDVAEVFEHPRFFHLGFDEETAWHQSKYSITVVRQGDLWWHDFLYIAGVAERTGARPWIWSDRIWRHREDFLNRMPKSVLQSNWYYAVAGLEEGEKPNPANRYVAGYEELEKAGFDQVPCGSNYGSSYDPRCNAENFGLTVDYCVRTIAPERLKGFLFAPWQSTRKNKHDRLDGMIPQVKDAMALYARVKR